MRYFLNLFSPQTWETFCKSSNVSGFRKRQQRSASKIKIGDTFVCYLTKVSRWCGVLKITSEMYSDTTPIFEDPDPYVVRFRVEPLIILEPEHSVPIVSHWDNLSITKDHVIGSRGWTGAFRQSLSELSQPDGRFLVGQLEKQKEENRLFPFTDKDRRNLKTLEAKTPSGRVLVEVPSRDQEDVEVELADDVSPAEARDSLQIQAKIAQIGALLGFKIWLPRSDKARVLSLCSDELKGSILEELPLSYDESTFQTIEQIDVIWLQGRSIARAFEVEHTTAVYSGLLRMADLLALQQNINISLHIVAPDERREKVFQEIKRPTFSLLGGGPLYGKCTFLSYDSIEEIEGASNRHTKDSIIEDYEEHAKE
ncbi:MAG: EVE domain-containing protein [Gammaproteobacteria bacterium]|nr:EVE domain-containing protein [Gammaproteobacteria bacterium]